MPTKQALEQELAQADATHKMRVDGLVREVEELQARVDDMQAQVDTKDVIISQYQDMIQERNDLIVVLQNKITEMDEALQHSSRN